MIGSGGLSLAETLAVYKTGIMLFMYFIYGYTGEIILRYSHIGEEDVLHAGASFL